ncbi:N-acetylglucosaminylphosphatidylinositol deacetylase [Onchocerca flexuosa]|uniref:N-acetylglucosaminylphosphatidylinositol deacetylase n=1 Tax=Onchocerca flexuosa TaxID=387005 RepID=A0A238C6H7_9BILA|nr:N-acetylglucosaminylphosphatidylinositol deacetylase [Onchocerca flexuosa]
MILPLFGFFIVTFLLLLSLLCDRAKRRSLPKCRRALLVIAHPDDETMFFTPTLHGLRLSGSNIYLLCISTGNSSGLGVTRKYELASAFIVHGLSLDNLTILDYDNFQDGFIQWSKEELAKVILRHMQMLDVDLVITFDEGGVSAHPNHIGCFRALQYLYTNGLIPAGVQVTIQLPDFYFGTYRNLLECK